MFTALFVEIFCLCNLRPSVKNNDMQRSQKVSILSREVTITFYHDIVVWDNREMETRQ